MKTILLLTFCLMIFEPLQGQITNSKYDSSLAKKLGADEYGMKNYILVILKTGENKTTDQDFISEQFSGHLKNIERLADEGKLIIAGPLGRNEHAYRGIFVLDVSTEDKAEELLQTDPAIREGLLAADLFEWYGSAALPFYLDAADKIWKAKP